MNELVNEIIAAVLIWSYTHGVHIGVAVLSTRERLSNQPAPFQSAVTIIAYR